MTDTHTTAHIPDGAVQAAIKSFESTDNNCETYQDMRKALAAALPYLSAPCAVEVTKLEWHNVDAYCAWCYADTEFGQYRVTWSFNETGQKLHFPDGTTKQFNEKGYGDRDAAKAAAQADFERRILSCVVTKPVDVAAARRQALEEAANAAENLDKAFDSKVGSHAATAIRALSAEPAQENHYKKALQRIVNLDEAMGHDLNESHAFEAVSIANKALTSEPAQGDQRHPIDTAPKDGTEILAWREDCGWLIVSYTSLDAFPMTQSELDELDEETLFQKDWFTQFGQFRLEGSEVPTHWMPLPAAPTSKGGE